MLKVGLTGGIGSGKSTVSAMFSKVGIAVIDADIIAREVLNIYPELICNIKESFGEHFFDEKGELLRRKLGDFVFKHSEEKQKLEDILLPSIKKEIFKAFDKNEEKGESICILDAPTLIETGLNNSMDFNIVVWVDSITQIRRLSERDNFTKEQTVRRINSQMPLDKKTDYANFVIDNSKEISYTKEQVNNIVIILKSMVKK